MLQGLNVEELKTLEAALALIEEDGGGYSSLRGSLDNSSSSTDPHEVEGFPDFDFESNKATVCKGKNINSSTSPDAQEIQRLKENLALPGRNRSRDLQKLELLQLRVDAEALQRQSDELGDHQITPAPSANDILEGYALLGKRMRLDAWKMLAMKHKKHRIEAEAENQNLRELYASQLKTTNTLKKLLAKQASLK
ncbi:hypothetical protein PInf_017253 [Phytophthora infestans]|nr:hypothetical protein PInf_017253 [Phytophthora infestans]